MTVQTFLKWPKKLDLAQNNSSLMCGYYCLESLCFYHTGPTPIIAGVVVFIIAVVVLVVIVVVAVCIRR